jgi:hypothetical protein
MDADSIFQRLLEELQRREIASTQAQRFHVQDLHDCNEAQQHSADGGAR